LPICSIGWSDRNIGDGHGDLTIVGLIQGNAWLNGEAIYRVLPEIHLYYVIRVAAGLLIVSGAYVGLYNMVRTLFFNPGDVTQ
jgi:cytochrome c oxidase cbb3-type subunit 1